jgi:hypothetical protein
MHHMAAALKSLGTAPTTLKVCDTLLSKLNLNFKHDAIFLLLCLLPQLPSVVVSLGTGIPPQKNAVTSHLDIAWPSGVFDAISKAPRLASLIGLLVDQATQSEGAVVERGRAWTAATSTPFFRLSPRMSTLVELDEREDSVLVELMWETRAYTLKQSAALKEMKAVLLAKK